MGQGSNPIPLSPVSQLPRARPKERLVCKTDVGHLTQHVWTLPGGSLGPLNVSISATGVSSSTADSISFASYPESSVFLALSLNGSVGRRSFGVLLPTRCGTRQ